VIIVAGYFPKANSFSGFQGKTLWDWLSLLVVPTSLAALAAWLQHKQQERELKIAEDNRQEEALQHYLDRVSNLLIEKNLPAITANVARGKNTPEEKELLDVSLDAIRTMTLTTLRRLNGDRKAIVILQFLTESGLMRRELSSGSMRRLLKISLADPSSPHSDGHLSGASLSGASLSSADLSNIDLSYVTLRGVDLRKAVLMFADLSGAVLIDANLSGATLSMAYLSGTFFRDADLTGANLRSAKLNGADLRDTKLSGAYLNSADLSGADLSGADLSGAEGLTKEQLEEAYLCKVKLPKGIYIDPDRDCGKPYDAWFSEHGYI
jgi:uncharacterized protein YjbI with pentapeptide repeats